MFINVPKLTRVTVVDEFGQEVVFERYRTRIRLDVQDDGRTLKIYVQPGIDQLREIP